MIQRPYPSASAPSASTAVAIGDWTVRPFDCSKEAVSVGRPLVPDAHPAGPGFPSRWSRIPIPLVPDSHPGPPGRRFPSSFTRECGKDWPLVTDSHPVRIQRAGVWLFLPKCGSRCNLERLVQSGGTRRRQEDGKKCLTRSLAHQTRTHPGPPGSTIPTAGPGFPSGTPGSTIPIVIHPGMVEGLATDGRRLSAPRTRKTPRQEASPGPQIMGLTQMKNRRKAFEHPEC